MISASTAGLRGPGDAKIALRRVKITNL